MLEVSVNKFRANIKDIVDKAIDEHQAIRINRRSGKDFIVISAEDWEREQETLYVLRNRSLMSQIAQSLETNKKGTGFKPSQEQIDEINHF